MLPRSFYSLLLTAAQLIFVVHISAAQSIPENPAIPRAAYQSVMTYVNPVLQGDHPDPTLLKVGDDFYMCGSSFHFAPNLPILHSRDLLHWETISRVVPAGWGEMKKEAPGGGIWQGAITYFYGTYRIYFANSSAGGQYFSTAPTPAGPWSAPVKVQGTAETGYDGYDNSVFVDDDGTPYLLIKSGQLTNRIQQINKEGHLTGRLINLDWVNANKRYSWAEGPVMCKRNGWYYYFVAGDVTGGQYVLRSRTLTGDSARWEKLGKVVTLTGPTRPFPGLNHMSAPFPLADGSWWCLAQSYEKTDGNDWSGQGRQELLCRVQWDANGKPNIFLDETQPQLRPELPVSGGLALKLPRSDNFSSSQLGLQWHFLNKSSAQQYSLKTKPGWVTISPGNNKSHVLQKEAGHYYSLVSRVDNAPAAPDQQAGIYITSGNDSVNVKLYSGFADGKRQVIFSFGKQQFAAPYQSAEPVWLKLIRNGHFLTAYYGNNGKAWKSLGEDIDVSDLDKAQPNFNAWVGSSMGLFAAGQAAGFDLFRYRDARSALPLAGYNSYYGVTRGESNGQTVYQASSGKGGWLMLGGIDFGDSRGALQKTALNAPSSAKGKLEIWADDLGRRGHQLATVNITTAKGDNKWQTVVAGIDKISGQHDIYLKWVAGTGPAPIKDIKFLPGPAN